MVVATFTTVAGRWGGRDRQDGDVSVGTSSVSTVAAAF